MQIPKTRHLLAVLLLFLLCTAEALSSLPGSEYWVCFPKNFRSIKGDTLDLSIVVTAEKKTGVVISTTGGYTQELTVEADDMKRIQIPAGFALDSTEGRVQNLALHIVAENPVTVYAVNSLYQSTDTYKALPVEEWGMQYYVASFSRTHKSLLSQFSIIAGEDSTRVTIQPKVATDGRHAAGSSYTVLLNEGDIYNVVAGSDTLGNGDLSGSFISSDKPVALVSGHNCANVPSRVDACNLLVEQVPPVSGLGREFYAGPLALRKQYMLRVIATEDSTTLSVRSDTQTSTKLLNRGEYSTFLCDAELMQLRTSKPAMLAQYSLGYKSGDPNGDPFMMMIQSVREYKKRYVIATPLPYPSLWSNYINIIIHQQDIFSLKVDGNEFPAERFRQFPGTDYYYGCFKIGPGCHIVEADGSFGMNMFGFGSGIFIYDAYGNL